MQVALEMRETQGEKEGAGAYLRRTRTEYTKDVVKKPLLFRACRSKKKKKITKQRNTKHFRPPPGLLQGVTE